MSDTRTLQKLKWQADAAEITYGHAQPARPSKRRVSAMASATRFTGVGTREQTAGDGGVLCFCMQAGARTGGRAVRPCSAATCGGPSTTRIFFWPTQEAGALLARLRCPCPSPTPTMSSGRAWTLRVVATPINELIYCYGYYFLFGTDQFIFFLPKKDKRITILIFFYWFIMWLSYLKMIWSVFLYMK